MTRTTNGIATSACAIGMSHDEPRRSSGGWSRAMRNPKPTVTADDAERQRAARASRPRRRDDAERERAPQPPTIDARSTVAATREAQRVRDRLDRRHEQRAAGVDLAERPVEVEAVAARVGRNDRSTSTSERYTEQQRPSSSEVGAEERAAPSGAGVGGRSRPRRAEPQRDAAAALDPAA